MPISVHLKAFQRPFYMDWLHAGTETNAISVYRAEHTLAIISFSTWSPSHVPQSILFSHANMVIIIHFVHQRGGGIYIQVLMVQENERHTHIDMCMHLMI